MTKPLTRVQKRNSLDQLAARDAFNKMLDYIHSLDVLRARGLDVSAHVGNSYRGHHGSLSVRRSFKTGESKIVFHSEYTSTGDGK